MTSPTKSITPKADGSVSEFDKNWKERKETKYNHWTRGLPKNQIQLAFRNHWVLFKTILEDRPRETCLEVGGGRGSLSSYFADSGFKCTLLDTSQSILDSAKKVFENNGHSATFIEGNAMSMPFEDNSFDVVTSIGLFEHFEDIETPLKEQWRVLKPGGTCLIYIVPERPDNIQRHFKWINNILKCLVNNFSNPDKKPPPKTDIFRSDYGSERYLPALKTLNVTDIEYYGMYPLPMISHSPEFPFSLLPGPVEWILTRVFEFSLFCRKIIFGKNLNRRNPWTCSEKTGQAFLVAFRKGQ